MLDVALKNCHFESFIRLSFARELGRFSGRLNLQKPRTRVKALLGDSARHQTSEVTSVQRFLIWKAGVEKRAGNSVVFRAPLSRGDHVCDA